MFSARLAGRAVLILVSVSVSGQYQHILMVSESVKYVIQVPFQLFMQYYYEIVFFKVIKLK